MEDQEGAQAKLPHEKTNWRGRSKRDSRHEI